MRSIESLKYLSSVDFPAPRKPLIIVHGTLWVVAECSINVLPFTSNQHHKQATNCRTADIRYVFEVHILAKR